mmetsp:Transcript_62498/g.103035  ORF Transcript_62498/g.103035 Transcript_62498/m.103035 type:complete len:99 (-) Transcript_62498:65-361(-)
MGRATETPQHGPNQQMPKRPGPDIPATSMWLSQAWGILQLHLVDTAIHTPTHDCQQTDKHNAESKCESPPQLAIKQDRACSTPMGAVLQDTAQARNIL